MIIAAILLSTSLTAVVVAVDPAARTITVRAGGAARDVTFAVDAPALQRAGALSPGQPVVLTGRRRARGGDPHRPARAQDRRAPGHAAAARRARGGGASGAGDPPAFARGVTVAEREPFAPADRHRRAPARSARRSQRRSAPEPAARSARDSRPDRAGADADPDGHAHAAAALKRARLAVDSRPPRSTKGREAHGAPPYIKET